MPKDKTKNPLLALLLAVSLLVRATPAQDKTFEDVIVINTDLVVLRASVTDKQGRAITGLKKENFKIFEDGTEQTVEVFSAEESPVSWGLVLDRSGSMMEMMREVYQASLHVIDEGTSRDEMFIAVFNEKPELVGGFSSDKHRLENSTLGLRADGNTALYDAVAFALDEFRQGKFRKKVLVVVTDGEDNASRLPFRKLIERAEEEEVIIYTVGMFESSGMSRYLSINMGGNARGELEKLAEVTGGRAHFPKDPEDCRRVMNEIALEVSRQYSLGYYPTNETYDDKWRKIRLQAKDDKSQNALVARTRSGYYAKKRAK
jgi:Ca-activated chloride channel homolog